MAYIHPEAKRARLVADKIENNNWELPIEEDVARELRICADTIDQLYNQAYFFISKPRFLRKRRD